jgi:hypothetical protein
MTPHLLSTERGPLSRASASQGAGGHAPQEPEAGGLHGPDCILAPLITHLQPCNPPTCPKPRVKRCTSSMAATTFCSMRPTPVAPCAPSSRQLTSSAHLSRPAPLRATQSRGATAAPSSRWAFQAVWAPPPGCRVQGMAEASTSQALPAPHAWPTLPPPARLPAAGSARR